MFCSYKELLSRVFCVFQHTQSRVTEKEPRHERLIQSYHDGGCARAARTMGITTLGICPSWWSNAVAIVVAKWMCQRLSSRLVVAQFRPGIHAFRHNVFHRSKKLAKCHRSIRQDRLGQLQLLWTNRAVPMLLVSMRNESLSCSCCQ